MRVLNRWRSKVCRWGVCWAAVTSPNRHPAALRGRAQQTDSERKKTGRLARSRLSDLGRSGWWQRAL